MLKFFIIPAAILFAGSLYLVSTTSVNFNPKFSGPSPPSPTPASSPSSRYTIPSLQKQSYDADLTVERQVRTTSGFTSRVVSYSSENLKQYALQNTPTGSPPASGWPVVIVNHGYIEPSVYSVESSYINTSAYFASAGFMVFKPDYRGHDNSQGDAHSLTSRISYGIDVLNLIAAIKKLPSVDSDRIYMYGHSMGGDVSLRVAAVCPDCVRAVSLWAPAVTSFPKNIMFFTDPASNPDPTGAARRQARQQELEQFFHPSDYSGISPMDNLSYIRAPVVIHHGTSDASVPYQWGVDLAAAFKAASRSAVLYTYPGDDHDITRNWSTALNRDIEFFNSN